MIVGSVMVMIILNSSLWLTLAPISEELAVIYADRGIKAEYVNYVALIYLKMLELNKY